MAFEYIAERLAKQKHQYLYRQSVNVQGQLSRAITINDKQYLNFSSNDYLGLASEPKLIKAWQKGAELFGIGSGGSYLVTGQNQVHSDITMQLKEWLGVDAIALFSSGYSANQAIIKLLMAKNDLLIQDKLNHASLIEAGRLTEAKMQRFKHNDSIHLESLLSKSLSVDNKLVITEGVFSMDGDCAPIDEIQQISKKTNAWFMVDDAHGLGVLGAQGKGSVVNQQICNNEIDIYMATFGKALGVSGAFVAGSQQFIDYLVNFSKTYTYTTGLPPALVYCIGEAANLAATEQWRRDSLAELISYFQQLAKSNDIPLLPSYTAIQPIIIGDSQKTLLVSDALKRKGIWTTAIRPPTVAINSARLRVTLTSNHKKQDIELLVQAIRQALDEQ